LKFDETTIVNGSSTGNHIIVFIDHTELTSSMFDMV